MWTVFLCFSLFCQENTGATRISLTPAKHLCHIIKLSQSSLCYSEDNQFIHLDFSLLLCLATQAEVALRLLFRATVLHLCQLGDTDVLFHASSLFLFHKEITFKAVFSPSLSFHLFLSASIIKWDYVLASNKQFARMTVVMTSSITTLSQL